MIREMSNVYTIIPLKGKTPVVSVPDPSNTFGRLTDGIIFISSNPVQQCNIGEGCHNLWLIERIESIDKFKDRFKFCWNLLWNYGKDQVQSVENNRFKNSMIEFSA